MQKQEAETLKPCPFCGGEADFLTERDERFGLIHKTECVACDYTFGSWQAGGKGRENAAKEWNTRHTTEPVVSEREVRELTVPLSEVLELLKVEICVSCWERGQEEVLTKFGDKLKQKYGVSE